METRSHKPTIHELFSEIHEELTGIPHIILVEDDGLSASMYGLKLDIYNMLRAAASHDSNLRDTIMHLGLQFASQNSLNDFHK